MAPFSVSIIVPTRDKAPYLELSLASLVPQPQRDLEIIVIDDGSADHTHAVVRRYERALPIRYLHHAKSLGRAEGRNAGARAATGRLLIFLDDDQIVAPGFVAAHRRRHARRHDLVLMGWLHGVLSIWSPALHMWDGNAAALLELFARRPALARLLACPTSRRLIGPRRVARAFDAVLALRVREHNTTRVVAPVVARYGDRLRGFALPWAIARTGNLSVRRDRFERAGGFDTDFRGYGMEDTDLCYRLHRGGAQLELDREAASFHQMHGRSPERLAELERNIDLFRGKHNRPECEAFVRWFRGAISLDEAARVAAAEARR